MEKETWEVKGSEDRMMPVDGYFTDDKKAPTAIFVHGYKGYKDWGAWNTMVPYFLKSGINLVKFNLSHNGGTVEQPIDFPDLEAFSKNTYSKEIFDINKIVEDLQRRLKVKGKKTEIYLLGHSRGGGDAILHAARDHNIQKLVTWSAISDIHERFPTGEKLEEWKSKGVRYEINSRTKQEMPVLIDIYDDAFKNTSKLDIMSAATVIDIPWLIIHGEKDEAVDVDEAFKLKGQSSDAELFIVDDTGHTFGTKHPYEKSDLGMPFKLVVEKTVEFFNRG